MNPLSRRSTFWKYCYLVATWLPISRECSKFQGCWKHLTTSQLYNFFNRLYQELCHFRCRSQHPVSPDLEGLPNLGDLPHLVLSFDLIRLLPVSCQIITWTNAEVLSVWQMWTYLSQVRIKEHLYLENVCQHIVRNRLVLTQFPGNRYLAALKLISPWTKSPPFRRRSFRIHFREWKVLYFD